MATVGVKGLTTKQTANIAIFYIFF